ncbi:PIG-L deacetylase family protein [Chloroflexota bacterium]
MNVLVFSPHPDDAEVLMGGTIARYTMRGHCVMIVLVTVPDQKERRVDESKRAAAILGAQSTVLNIDSYQLSFNRSLVESFDKIVSDFTPDIIFTSWLHDSHQDHIAVCQAAVASTRRNTCSVYMYEQAFPGGLSPFPFRAQAFVDISETIDLKIKSVIAHDSQFQHFTERWIEGIRGRAAYMGFRINVKYAEAFEIVKHIVD